jgi:DNA polymerase III delta prime subunit
MDYFKGTDDYVISPDLRDNVNVSIALQRPLIVKGEPGTGKTLLAHAIAKALEKELFIWNIKSTTKARKACTFMIQYRAERCPFRRGDVSDIKQYIKLGKLARLLTLTHSYSSD